MLPGSSHGGRCLSCAVFERLGRSGRQSAIVSSSGIGPLASRRPSVCPSTSSHHQALPAADSSRRKSGRCGDGLSEASTCASRGSGERSGIAANRSAAASAQRRARACIAGAIHLAHARRPRASDNVIGAEECAGESGIAAVPGFYRLSRPRQWSLPRRTDSHRAPHRDTARGIRRQQDDRTAFLAVRLSCIRTDELSRMGV